MGQTSSSRHKANSQPIDILLIEDDRSDVKIALRAFEKGKIGNDVYVVNDGQEALDFIYHEGTYQDKEKYPRPDLILLDINMPKLDGFGVLKKLKGDPVYRTIPIIMLTSSRDEEDIAKSYGSGAASFIQKPISYDSFVSVVDGFNFYWHIINKLPAKQQKSAHQPLNIEEGEYFERPILVIEDSEQDRKAMAICLHRAGYQNVLFASSGREGLKIASMRKPHIVVIDTMLPGEDGFSICKQVREVSNLHAGIVMLTGQIHAVNSDKAKEAGADLYTVKDPEYALLLEKIRDLRDAKLEKNIEEE